MAMRFAFLALASLQFAPGAARAQVPAKPAKAELLRWERQAQAVMMLRDCYGVPNL